MPELIVDIIETGIWKAKQEKADPASQFNTFIESSDFTHDVRLYIDGDFKSKKQRLKYAEEIAKRLNMYKKS